MTATLSTEVDFRGCFFGTTDWASYYDSLQPLAEEVKEILQRTCPFYPKKRMFETHLVFQGIQILDNAPLTVAKWLELHPPTSQLKFYFNTNPWHAGQPHTDEATLEPRLYIMLREIVPGSTYKKPDDQLTLLPEDYKVPTTIEEVTKSILGFRKTSKRFNPNVWAACKERTIKTNTANAGDVSCVGRFDEDGLGVSDWRGHRNDNVGVGASRILKLESLRT